MAITRVALRLSAHPLPHQVQQFVLGALGPAVRQTVIQQLVDADQGAHRELVALPVKASHQRQQLVFSDPHAKGFSTSCTSNASAPPFV